jgi:hypothetical protein
VNLYDYIHFEIPPDLFESTRGNSWLTILHIYTSESWTMSESPSFESQYSCSEGLGASDVELELELELLSASIVI